MAESVGAKLPVKNRRLHRAVQGTGGSDIADPGISPGHHAVSNLLHQRVPASVGYGNSRLQPHLPGRFREQCSRRLPGLAAFRKQRAVQAQPFQDLPGPLPVPDVKGHGSGGVRVVRSHLPAHAETDIILRQKHLRGPAVMFRLMLPQPHQRAEQKSTGQIIQRRLMDELPADLPVDSVHFLFSHPLVRPYDCVAD